MFPQMDGELPEIAFDESGNTGADLLNMEQPVFALASTSISRERADHLLAIVRTRQTREVKFSQLKRTETGRSRIINFLSSTELCSEYVRTTFFHKRFMVVTKIVDLLIETMAYEEGIDLYVDGANIATANLHFYCMPTFCGEGRTKAFLRCFVEMMREGTPKAIQRFYQSAWTLHQNSIDRDYAESLAPILISERLINFILSSNDKNSIDPAIPAFVQHCSFWGEEFGGPFELVHDESKPIFQNKEMLEDLMSRGEQEQVIGYDRRKMIFPLRARGVTFGKSEDDPRLQIADLIASASAHWMSGLIRPPEKKDFWEALRGTNIARFGQDAIWPTPEVTPQELDTVHDGGINATDHMAEFLATHRRKI